jgi:signal transduction histidine kinase
MDASRQAGMAEVATGVLHNVGNVLNSVNISTTLISECLQRAKTDNLVRAAEMLRTLSSDSSPEAEKRRQALPSYFKELSGELNDLHEQMKREAKTLDRNVSHIRDIISTQQGYARMAGVVDTIKVTDLVEDAIAINEAAFQRHGIRIEHEIDGNLSVTADKHKVLQILVNLLHNAKYALHGVACGEKCIQVTANGADSSWLTISVQDNGIGIEPEKLERIFAHGYTTRSDGHGFGLHSGAIAAQEMGGTLSAYSEGSGCGSRFTLKLPLTPKTNHQT